MPSPEVQTMLPMIENPRRTPSASDFLRVGIYRQLSGKQIAHRELNGCDFVSLVERESHNPQDNC